jgi:hypothetical protein
MRSSWPTEVLLRSPPEMPFRKKPPAQRQRNIAYWMGRFWCRFFRVNAMHGYGKS